MPPTLTLAGREIVPALVTIFLESIFLHLSARLLALEPNFLQALLTAVLGGVLAGVVFIFISGFWGAALAVVVWLAVCASIYRIGLFRALLLGILAALLYLVARWVVLWIQRGAPL